MTSWRDALYPVLEPLRGLRFQWEARPLAPLRADAGWPALFDRVAATRFAPIQIRSEIVPLCELVRSRRPQIVCEIGAASGGTFFLFSRCAADTAIIVSVDLRYTPSKRFGYPRLLLPGQTAIAVAGDSHAPATAEKVKSLVGGAGIDFLFIDGDHEYDGVVADYELFSPLVKPDGLIGFHDIIPDFGQRFGTRRNADSGGVPRFWAELKARHGEATSEFVEHPEQDGFGIGVLDLRRLTQAARPRSQ